MKEIKLSNGQKALIDDEDWDKVKDYSWYASQCRNKWYVKSHMGDWNHNVYLHRFIMNAPKGRYVDHIDGNGYNNLKSNLRFCTRRQNQMNQQVQQRKKSSKYKGVSWIETRQIWRSYIKLYQKQIFLGHFEDEVLAAEAYNQAAVKYFGVFACLNVI